MSLMFKISYGLYILSASDNGKHNACMINTLAQQTSNPERLSVTVNKANLTHDIIAKTKLCSVSVLGEDTAFETIKRFGMQSGRNADKFDNIATLTTQNGHIIPENGCIGYFDLRVENSIDFGSHTMFVCSVTGSNQLRQSPALTYDYYQTNIKPKPVAAADEGESWVCNVCGYVHKGELPKDIVCPICKHGASDFVKVDGANIDNNKKINIIQGESKMTKWVCPVCGYVHEGTNPPEFCPQCKVPGSKFRKQEGEMSWAAEHVVGIAKDVPDDIKAGLRANFEGECCEVGMYLAMSRVAHREGYPEIGLYWEKAALEEAEHAAKFAELLGEVLSDSTKENLTKRVDAENGATQGKFDLAKRAKEEGLDAIHDTVHEMARDEARHGKAFAGLLARYFG